MDIKERFSESDPFTKLVQQHGKIDPFDAFNIIPYEKVWGLLQMPYYYQIYGTITTKMIKAVKRLVYS